MSTSISNHMTTSHRVAFIGIGKVFSLSLSFGPTFWNKTGEGFIYRRNETNRTASSVEPSRNDTCHEEAYCDSFNKLFFITSNKSLYTSSYTFTFSSSHRVRSHSQSVEYLIRR